MVCTKEIDGVTHYFQYVSQLYDGKLVEISKDDYDKLYCVWDKYGEEVTQLYIDRGLLK